MCTFLLQNGALWDICLMYSGICEMGLLHTFPLALGYNIPSKNTPSCGPPSIPNSAKAAYDNNKHNKNHDCSFSLFKCVSENSSLKQTKNNKNTTYFIQQPLIFFVTLQWRHNGRDGASNHQPHDCLLNRFIQAQIKEMIKAPRHWPLWGEFIGDRWIPLINGQ